MRIQYSMLSLSLVAFVVATPSSAQSDAAKRFGALESIQQVSLSPDGTHAAMIGAAGGRRQVVMVADLVQGGPPKAIFRADGGPEWLYGCSWASNTRLLCNVHVIAKIPLLVGLTRVISISSDGSDSKLLTQQNGEKLDLQQNGGEIIDSAPDDAPGWVLVQRQFVPEFSTGTHIAEQREGLGVELVDAATLHHKPVEPPAPDATGYISDGHGNIRIRALRPTVGTGYLGSKVVYSYRKAGSHAWLSLVSGDADHAFAPAAVDPKLNLVYGFDDKDGRSSLYSIALDGSLTKSLVLSNPDVDITDLIQIGHHSRVVGASYVTDRTVQEFFDPDIKKLRAALSRAIPAKPLINFIDSSEDESKLVIHASADNDPGTFYLLDRTQHKLEEILPARPELSNTPLATVKSVTYPAADGKMIPAYLTLPPGGSGKNLPAIVMPHGGPTARDEWGFDWLVQFFAARGFAVLQPNYRGSSGYGQDWLQNNGFQSWRAAIGDIDDGGRWLLAQGIAAPGKIAIVGWSYGGYAALQSGVTEPDLFKAIVAIAPVTDLDTLRAEHQDFVDFYLADKQIGTGPHVAAGSPARHAAEIKAPVLMFHGDIDQNVGIAESRVMAAKLRGAGKKVELVEFKDLDHNLRDSDARATMLDKADGFLRSTLGLPPLP